MACRYVALFQEFVDTLVNGRPSLFRIDIRWKLLFPTLCWSINTKFMVALLFSPELYTPRLFNYARKLIYTPKNWYTLNLAWKKNYKIFIKNVLTYTNNYTSKKIRTRAVTELKNECICLIRNIKQIPRRWYPSIWWIYRISFKVIKLYYCRNAIIFECYLLTYVFS
jgi:hypothetical protein